MAGDIQNIKSFYKGQNIFQEGQKGTTAFMIKKGSVNIYRLRNNKRILLDRLGQGEIFGELGALAGADRTTSAEAAEFCELMVLTKTFVGNLLKESPKTIRHLTKLLTRRLEKAESRSGSMNHKNSFLSICKILELAYKAHTALSGAAAKKNPNHSLGLNVLDLSRDIKDIIVVSQQEVEGVIKQLASLKIVEISIRKAGKAFEEKYIKLSSPGTFYKVALNLYRELKKSERNGPELEHIDIYDLAQEVESTPEIIYGKMAQQEIPETLFTFSRKNTLNWAKEQGPDFFKSVKRKKKKIQDLEDVNDIVYVDNATLKDTFATMGYYKIGVLLAVAHEDARKKILGNLAKKIATIVKDEADRREVVDESEALDVQDELIGLIKTAKGVSI